MFAPQAIRAVGWFRASHIATQPETKVVTALAKESINAAKCGKPVQSVAPIVHQILYQLGEHARTSEHNAFCQDEDVEQPLDVLVGGVGDVI
jgi:hypothetical protein